MHNEFNGTSLEFVGVFHWHERISFFQSPCLYYPRSNSITAGPGSPYHSLFIAAFTAAGVTPSVAHESAEWETSAALVGAGVGVSLLPRLASLAGEDNVSRVRLTGSGRLSRKIIAAMRAGSRRSPLIRDSLQHLRTTSQYILSTRLREDS
ncbi:LysR substrate-binding domain-containing protein [Micrococcaceae sp. AOP34-BR2-30]|uniref:LysR substrate-binding domain-containing protein n=2 Tax=Brevibacterium aurantiacum TaxID=273384 RepID=UPI001F0A2621|nr:LysR substrate-binding domain-containing protein [Brevibacterium aurantiacum]